jgi:molecular chaperone Hsp33
VSGAARDDFVRSFRLEAAGVRGRHVRLGRAIDTVLTQHDYPEPVSRLLGELIALAALLSSTIKYDGIFTVQTRGDGPLRMMVADVTSAGALRGYADFDADALAVLPRDEEGGSVPRLLGAGHLAFTVDQGPETERYQGIVALEGASLSDCAHNYFRQSEQIATAIRISADLTADGWRAGALMLQREPSHGGRDRPIGQDAWPDTPDIGLEDQEEEENSPIPRGIGPRPCAAPARLRMPLFAPPRGDDPQGTATAGNRGAKHRRKSRRDLSILQ